VWTGAATPKEKGTATCGDWKGLSGTTPAITGDDATSAAPDWFNHPTRTECKDTSTRLMCLETVDPKQ
jgi:hypothetical protein